MFTGLVEEKGCLEEIRASSMSSILTIRAKQVLEGVQLGDSIAVNGVCLTVTSFSENRFTCDVMPETMKKTNLGKLARGEVLNLERAMKIGDRFGGHIVSGHVDGTGEIISRETYENAVLFQIKAKPELLRYMIPRGSVCIDGISLTIIDVTDSSFSISIIPHTLAHTNLEGKRAGAIVNLECDVIGKYVERLLAGGAKAKQRPSSVGLEYLREHGFA